MSDHSNESDLNSILVWHCAAIFVLFCVFELWGNGNLGNRNVKYLLVGTLEIKF